MKLLMVVLLMFPLGNAGADKHKEVPTNKKSISEIMNELKLAKTEIEKFNLQSEALKIYASQSLNSANLGDAKELANSVLKTAETFKSNWDYGNAIHHAHLVLGRVYLFNGKIDGAISELSLAAKVSGSPQLASFGPNMTLAKELLLKGQKIAVLDYIEVCLKFWKSQFAESSVKSWKDAISKGEIPNFEGNLFY